MEREKDLGDSHVSISDVIWARVIRLRPSIPLESLYKYSMTDPRNLFEFSRLLHYPLDLKCFKQEPP